MAANDFHNDNLLWGHIANKAATGSLDQGDVWDILNATGYEGPEVQRYIIAEAQEMGATWNGA